MVPVEDMTQLDEDSEDARSGSLWPHVEERVLDLPMREADVAIRMKEPSQADLIRKKLMGIRIGLYASRDYLERSQPLERIEDIAQHRVITQGPTSAPSPCCW